MNSKNEHTNSKGVACPYCGSHEIEGGPVEIHEGQTFQEVSCTSCNAAWQNEYTLVNTSMISHPKKYKTLPQTSERLIMLDVDATDLFANESPDWNYCIEQAPFSHKEACEFMLYIGYEDDETFEDRLHEMREYDEVSDKLIELMKIARQQKAAWLMLHT